MVGETQVSIYFPARFKPCRILKMAHFQTGTFGLACAVTFGPPVASKSPAILTA
jgi:hypothetical protein